MLNCKKRTPSSALPRYSSAAQCSAVRCRAVPCLVRCGAVMCRPCHAVPCCAVCCISNTQQYQISCEKYQVPGAAMNTRVRIVEQTSFCFLHLIVLSRSCLFFANYTRTADQNVASPTSTQHSTGQAALPKELLALPNRWMHHIMGLLFWSRNIWVPNRYMHEIMGLLFWPRNIWVCFPWASTAGGVSRPRSEALV